MGHAKLVDKVKSVAKQEKGKPLVYLSHSYDKKKNPLDYKTKAKVAKAAFGPVIQMSSSKNIIQILQELEKKNYTDIVVVVGSDRVSEFDNLIAKYNGKDYNFNSLKVVSAGERDPDAEGVEGMSASKLRQTAIDGDYAAFASGIAPVSDAMKKSVYDTIRKWANVK